MWIEIGQTKKDGTFIPLASTGMAQGKSDRINIIGFEAINITRNPLPADGRSKAEITATVQPSDCADDVKLTISEGRFLLSNVEGENTTKLTVTSATAEGDVKVRASLTLNGVTCHADGVFQVTKNGGCSSCSSGSCSIGGAANIIISSIDASFTLGTNADSKQTGKLYIKEDVPRLQMYTPESLQISPVLQGVQVVYGRDVIDQVKGPQALVVVTPHVSGYKYTLAYYSLTQATWNDGYKRYDTTGQPFVEWVIGHPDVIANDGATPTNFNLLSIVKYVGGSATHHYDYVYDSVENTWSLATGLGQSGSVDRKESRKKETLANGDRKETYIVKDAADVVAYKETKTYHTYTWNGQAVDQVIEQVVDPDAGGAQLQTLYTYVDPGRLESVRHSDGSWTRYTYDANGRIVTEIRPLLDAGFTAQDSQTVVTLHEYDVDGISGRNRETRYVGGLSGVAVARSYEDREIINDGGVEKLRVTSEECTDPTAAYGADASMKSVTTYTDRLASRVESVEHPDGLYDTYLYENGTYNKATYAFTPPTGDALRTTVTHKYKSGGTVSEMAGKSTREITVADEGGQTCLEEKYVCTAADQYALLGQTRHDYENGHRTHSYFPNGSETESHWGCCHQDWVIDANGGKTTYDVYDAAGRLIQQTREGSTSGNAGEPGYRPAIVTAYTYDGMGRQKTTTVNSVLMSQSDYDLAGRTQTTTDMANLTTGHEYSPASLSSGKWTKVTRPGQVGEKTEYYCDGRIKRVVRTSSPNEVVLQYYEYGIESGKQYTKVYTGDLGAAMYTMTLVDALGRTVEERRAGFPANGNATTVVTSYDYCPDNTVPNSKGKVKQTTMTAGSTVMIALYEYNALGEQTATGQNLDGTAGLTRTPPGGTTPADRISETETAYEQAQNIWWQVTRSKVYRDGQSTPTTVNTQKSQITGLGGGITERTITQDVRGNQTTTTVTVDRTAKKVTTETAYPDTNERDISEVINGLAHRNVSKNGAVVQYGYDSLGRRIKVYDSRKGTTTTDYYGNGDGQKGKVYTVKDHENRTTTYTYISTTGQVFSVQNPLGKLQYYAYNDRGQMEMTWGDTTYPVKNDYDAMGRRVEMHTYQSGTSWNTASWPSPEPTHYQTTWEFDAASGQLKKKADANGQFVEYTYTPDGRQKTRTWARKINNTDNLITTYAYNDVTGEMTGITYSDGTPSVTYEYNRLGRQSKVIQTKAAPNGWTHTTTFNLNQYLELESEAITGDIYAKTITRNHQGSGTGLLPGRDAGLSIGNEYSVEYDYDEYGRLNYISGDSLGLPGGAVIYEYVPNSDLVNAVNYLDAGANDLAWTIRAYGTLTDHRDLLTSVENHNGSTVMSKYAYQYDNAGRRTAVLTTGEAFINNAYNIWGYNDRSELQASNRYNGNQIVIPPDPQTEVTGERRLYHYDPIGNRVDYTFGTGSPLYYCSENGLNQYDSTGVQQSCPQGNPSESFSYDHDGNMTADGALTYEWDGENRLTAVYPTNPASTSKKCTFTYDFMSRRIRKQVYTRNDNNTAWRSDPSEDWRFVYDQWNVVLVLDGRDGPDEGTTPDNVTVRKYTWGLDLSGLTGSVSSAGIHGAGGIGGLLAAVETGGEGDYVYWYLYDGNGNVGQVLDATDTENITTAALYEYDPYGNLIVADGYYALNNPFRFSTKWFDDETGLGYWGHRYYLPPLGRWISRDPIGEEGGLNLQGYVGNMPTKRVDLLGKYIIAVGGAGSIGDGDLMGTVMLLWGAESDWYNSCECNVVPFEGSVLISAPTGALWLIAPDWEGAVQKLTSNVKSYMDYYRQIMKRRDNGECVIPEQLHILGFSDGASTIALWLNRGAPSGARDFPNPIGLISLIDLVRTPYGELVPNGDRPDKAYEVNRAVGSRHVAFRNIDTVLNWAGYRIAQWNNNVIEPPVSHSQAAGSGTVRAALRREIDQITPEYMKDFGCECSGR